MKPMEIEQASMAIIERELQVALDPEIKPIVKRVIHATAESAFWRATAWARSPCRA